MRFCFGQGGYVRAKCLYSVKVVVIWQRWLYSDKVVVFVQKLLHSGKMVVFGQNWFYSGKGGCIPECDCI